MNEKSFSVLIHAIGIYTLFLIHGVYQEKLNTTYKTFNYSHTLFPMFLYSLGGVLVSQGNLYVKNLKKSENDKNLLFRYIFLSVLTLISAQLWSYSLQFMSYPTIVISKSCKLLSIAVMNFLIFRKKFTMRKYLTLLLTSASVLLFASFDTKQSNNSSSSYMGICLLIFNLSVDGFINVIQDDIVKKYKVSSLNMMYYFNLIRLIISFVLLVCTNNFLSSTICLISNINLAVDVLISTISNVLGQLFIYSMIEKHGTLTLSTINVARKMTSILISFFIFGHKLSFVQGISIFGVLSSIYLDFNEKNEKLKQN